MNTSGEAADQVVRMSLEVGEAALKISGAGAKQLAVLLYAILKEQKKTRGRARLETLVRSGRPLTVFSVKESDLRKFVQEAKRYGILYCAVRNPRGSSDGMVDIMVKEEDAPRINRIVERFQFASVTEAAQIKTEIEKLREQKAKNVGKEMCIRDRVRGYSFMEAIEIIAGQAAIQPPVSASVGQKTKKVLLLPKPYRYTEYVVSYLKNRGIDMELIDFCLKTGRLYESAEHHNAVFVGRDQENQPRYAALRGCLLYTSSDHTRVHDWINE